MKGMRTREDILSVIGQIDNIMKGLAIIVEEAKRKAEEFSSTPPEPFDLRRPGAPVGVNWRTFLRPFCSRRELPFG